MYRVFEIVYFILLPDYAQKLLLEVPVQQKHIGIYVRRKLPMSAHVEYVCIIWNGNVVCRYSYACIVYTT